MRQHDFKMHVSVQNHKTHRWSTPLQEPVRVLTTWCTLHHCRDFFTQIQMSIQDCAFVHTVQQWADTRKIEGPTTTICLCRQCRVLPRWKKYTSKVHLGL